MNIAQWLHRIARTQPDLPAIAVGRSMAHDYGRLSLRVARLAHGLCKSYDLKNGDRVAIIMENIPHYVESLFALWHAGLAAVPINAKLHPREIGFILENSKVALAIVSEKLAASIPPEIGCPVINCHTQEWEKFTCCDAMEMADLSGDQLAWLFYTSGTTGNPKGAMLSHQNLTTMTLNYFVDFDKIRPGDTIFHPAPLSHGSGLWMLPHICAGACNVLPQSAGFDPAEIFTDLQHWNNVSMFAAPTMVRRLALFRKDVDIRNLKLITYGGAPMYVADCVTALDRFDNKLAQLYGQGESPMTITHLPKHMMADRDHPDWRYRLATAGVVDSCMEIKIVDENDATLDAGQTGEICCRGDTVMQGYWQNPEATDAALRGGWLHTGDIGHIDENGFLTLTDRAKDLIISGGSNIYPREIEEVLLEIPRVEEASVIARPDPDWGEIVVAYVVGTATAQEMDSHCLARLARFKRPKLYRLIDQLPKNNYGKILKTTLREMEAARP